MAADASGAPAARTPASNQARPTRPPLTGCGASSPLHQPSSATCQPAVGAGGACFTGQPVCYKRRHPVRPTGAGPEAGAGSSADSRMHPTGVRPEADSPSCGNGEPTAGAGSSADSTHGQLLPLATENPSGTESAAAACGSSSGSAPTETPVQAVGSSVAENLGTSPRRT